MTIRIALNHLTVYEYVHPVALAPQVIRLRPAPHCRTPILSYSLKVAPEGHFENWQQDPQGNFLARCVFPEKASTFRVQVDLLAEMSVINPFDFFVESYAEEFPFEYEEAQARDLYPYLVKDEAGSKSLSENPVSPSPQPSPAKGRGSHWIGPKFAEFLASIDRTPRRIVDFLVHVNSKLQQQIKYLIRMEPGVQTPEETLERGCGSCRDSAWLQVQLLRHVGLAARFVSGYLVQLVPDVKPLDGPAGAAEDFTDLHAWTEVFVPGAGWIGLDPTSGLFAGEGHIPLACTPEPSSAAPISGAVEACESKFHFEMHVTRVHEDPRVTKPFTDEQWEQVLAAGRMVDKHLEAGDVRLTMGGEPTFVSIDDMESAEWNTAAVGPTKRQRAFELMQRLRERFAPRGMLHFGQGKWYPGESLPRWAFSCFWRNDEEPLWLEDEWVAQEGDDLGHGPTDAAKFTKTLATNLGVEDRWANPAYEDVWHFVSKERKLPENVTVADSKLKDPEERARLARITERGVDTPVGFVLPLRRQWWQAQPRWISGPWPLRSEKLFLLPGDSPIGLRLPLESLPWLPPSHRSQFNELDPFLEREPLPTHPGRQPQPEHTMSEGPSEGNGLSLEQQTVNPQETPLEPGDVVRTALCVEARGGRLHVFMPPVERLEDYLDLVHTIEGTAEQLNLPVVLEGYLPPHDQRLSHIKVTPDPGVIEVNVQPARNWEELVAITTGVYEDARLSRLGTEKFDLDGRHTGTGGGNHVVLGGATPADSPFLRRPDLLKSLLGFWNNHPSLSYLFSGTFIGPTSQAPRVDEGRRDALYELEIAFQQVPDPDSGVYCPPWLVDRIFRNLLVDLTGNTHRAEFCIDKLFSPDSASGRLGLVEFRAFEMPPHARMSLAQQLLLRTLVARFWERPYKAALIHWGTALHDRYLLPHFVWTDFDEVIQGCRKAGFPLETAWFAPHFEFRFPVIGAFTRQNMAVELRQAIEPWYVLGEEPAGGATTRFVDSSVERLQVKVTNLADERYALACNGRRAPLQPTGVAGEYVAAVRYRAWQPPSCLHPTIAVHTPLVFDLVDTHQGLSIGGCTYHVSHPGGLSYSTFPVNAYEAESRRGSRFFANGHTGGGVTLPPEERNRLFPLTLDLRRGSDGTDRA